MTSTIKDSNVAEFIPMAQSLQREAIAGGKEYSIGTPEEAQAGLDAVIYDSDFVYRYIAKLRPGKNLSGGVFNVIASALESSAAFVGVDWTTQAEMDEKYPDNVYGDMVEIDNPDYSSVSAILTNKDIFTLLHYYRQGGTWSVLHEDPDATLLQENAERYWKHLNEVLSDDVDPASLSEKQRDYREHLQEIVGDTSLETFDVVTAFSLLKKEHDSTIALINDVLLANSDDKMLLNDAIAETDELTKTYKLRIDEVHDHPEAGIKGDFFRNHTHINSLEYLLNTKLKNAAGEEIPLIELPGIAEQYMNMAEPYKAVHVHTSKYQENLTDILDYIYNQHPEKFPGAEGKGFEKIADDKDIYRIGEHVVGFTSGGISLDREVYEKKLLGDDALTLNTEEKKERFQQVMQDTEAYMRDTLGLDVDAIKEPGHKSFVIVSRREPSKRIPETVEALTRLFQARDDVSLFSVFNTANRQGPDGHLSGYDRNESNLPAAFDELRNIGQSNIYLEDNKLPHERIVQVFAYLAEHAPEVYPIAFGKDGYVLHGVEWEVTRQVVEDIKGEPQSTALAVPVGSSGVGHMYELSQLRGAVIAQDETADEYLEAMKDAIAKTPEEKGAMDDASRRLVSEINTKEAFKERYDAMMIDVMREQLIRNYQRPDVQLSDTDQAQLEGLVASRTPALQVA